jgi:F0F1-type ATP synthase membrane subunit b/b'
MHVPAELPSVAMGSALLLYLERILAVFAVLLFLLVFLYRGLWRGELPKAISERGAEWQDVLGHTDNLDDQLQALKAQLDSLERTVGTLPR